ncbi:EAL domain-containing protein [Bacillus sp. FJAT-44742]|uniref:EAL domain-containing protein n=1 Tax=Bacillus sp. FJAT-44742 TaxID=2014005 RepID=UPI000C24AD1C|nr:EAL-associated domain-containing protein [Bacillus sp. FJAT-44742]
MDALDIVLHKDKALPYFQPVIGADKQDVIGYEVVGRFKNEEEIISLGSFFQDQSVPEEYRLDMDEYIQDQAIQKYIDEEQDGNLFLNVDANLLVGDGADKFISRLRAREENEDFDMTRVVLIITEHDFHGEVSHLKYFIQYVQSVGIKVAIDDVEKSGTHLDRIAYLRPNIIKVNMDLIDDGSFPDVYREVLHSLSMLSRKIGAALLFKRISTFNQLNYAWRHGARYYQGSYLEKDLSDFVDPFKYKESLKKDFHHFLDFERKKIKAQLTLSEKLNIRLQEALHDLKDQKDYDHLAQVVAKRLDDLCFRVYICNEDGFQQSGNAVKVEGTWEYHPEDKSKNWSWRPYFLENIIRMNYEGRGFLSDLYTDIHKDELIRTYSSPINEQMYVFIDIPYSYLFEQDFLL